MRLLPLLLLGFIGLLDCVRAAGGGVLAIDYGTEWMKVSLVKAGVPFDVLLNTDSKRKIQSVVALRGEDRLIGGDAANLASRFPDSTFPSVKFLLGHGAADPQVAQFEALHRTKVYTNVTTNRASYYDAAAVKEDDVIKTPEEYMAMQFNHAKKLAKDAAGGESIKDTVVTVPAFFTQAERQAVLDALEIAGLKPLALLDDGSAVAINYAMTRSFPSEDPEYHLFYDAGAGSIRATIVSFKTSEVNEPPSSKVGKNVTFAGVEGLGWDRGVGGLAMDAKIRDMLEEQFLQKEGKSLVSTFGQNKRAHVKLLKEATRVKQVLSANAEAPSRIEGLADDIDFRGSITREAFEKACESLQPSFIKPINDALKAAELSMEDITSVIFVGGTSRVPMVRDAVKAIVGEEKIAQNVNADEAAVMGAALYGAAKSSQFRTKDIRLTGMVPYTIEHAYEAGTGPASGQQNRLLTSVIFGANKPIGVKKTLELRKSHDFSINFQYRTASSALDARPLDAIFTADISGLTTAYANLTDAEAANSTVQIVVEIDESNLLVVSSAKLVLPDQKEASSVKDKIKGFFGGNKEKEGDNNTAASSADAESTETLLPPKRSGPVSLKASIRHVGYLPVPENEKKDAIKRLRELDQAESRKKNREEARNGLEAYIYKLRDTLESDRFIEASTDGERIKIRKQLEEATEWLYDAGETAPTKDLRSAKSDLERSASAPTIRILEADGREKSVTDFRMGMIQAQAFLISATKQFENDTAAGEPSKYTEIELKTLENSVTANEKWLTETEKKQQSTKPNEDAVLRVADLDKKARELSAQVSVLKLKRPPRKPKKITSSSSSSPESTPSASTTTIPDATSSADAASQTEAQHERDEL